MAELAVAHYGGKALSGELSSAIKNGVNPNTATKGQPVLGGGTDNEAGTLVERTVIEGPSKGPAPWVSAEGKVGGVTYQDVNQTTGPLNESDPKIPSLITDRVAEKAAKSPEKNYPNGNMKDAHAEIGVIQQAYSSGKTSGADMSMSVTGKDVCDYCEGDIAAAKRAELKCITIDAVDDSTCLPKNIIGSLA